MGINFDKPLQWKQDISDSVDYYNEWFLRFAPDTFRAQRLLATEKVAKDLVAANDLVGLTPLALKSNPSILATLRMCCCPPIARDRLAGLANASKTLVRALEQGKLSFQSDPTRLDADLTMIVNVVTRLIDQDLFPWITSGTAASEGERRRAASVVADRLTGAQSDPIIRNEQERRQLAKIEKYLLGKGYSKQQHAANLPLGEMLVGTFAFRMNIVAGSRRTNIPVDCVIQPKGANSGGYPLLIEAKSAGDFANVNKRRKEEAQKMHQIQTTYKGARYILFLCGYFDATYLGYSASEGMDWIWEQRLSDMDQLGL